MNTPPTWQLPPHNTIEFRPKTSKYCVIIPVINEGTVFCNQLKKMKSTCGYIDRIVVDGGSTDGATIPAKLRTLGVTALITKQDGAGLSGQLRLGYAYGLSHGYGGVVTIDGNGKDEPEDIIKFVTALDCRYDYVQGSRFVSGGKAIHTPMERLLAIRFIHAPIISLVSGTHLTDTTNGFRGYSKKLLTDPRIAPFRNIFTTYELLAYISMRAPRIGMKTIEVPVTRRYPIGKTPTKIHLWGLWNLLRILFFSAIGFYAPHSK